MCCGYLRNSRKNNYLCKKTVQTYGFCSTGPRCHQDRANKLENEGLPLLVYQWMIKPKGQKLCLPKNEIYFCTKLLKNEKVNWTHQMWRPNPLPIILYYIRPIHLIKIIRQAELQDTRHRIWKSGHLAKL
jgi:hypothetical protein